MIFRFLRPPAFPQVDYVGYVILIIAAVRFISSEPKSAFILFLLSILILIMRSWIKLDLNRGTLTKFFIVVPYKTITIIPVDKIIITKKLVHQTLNSRGSTTSLRLHEFEILLMANNDIHLLKSGLDKDRLFNKAKKVAVAANVPLDDRTI